MSPTMLAHEVNSGLAAVLIAAGPVLAVAGGLGLFLGIVLAVIQIQEQTLPQVIKIATILIILVLFSAPLGQPLYLYTLHIFSDFHQMVR
jgi:type III secretory pathway component EscS